MIIYSKKIFSLYLSISYLYLRISTASVLDSLDPKDFYRQYPSRVKSEFWWYPVQSRISSGPNFYNVYVTFSLRFFKLGTVFFPRSSYYNVSLYLGTFSNHSYELVDTWMCCTYKTLRLNMNEKKFRWIFRFVINIIIQNVVRKTSTCVYDK